MRPARENTSPWLDTCKKSYWHVSPTRIHNEPYCEKQAHWPILEARADCTNPVNTERNCALNLACEGLFLHHVHNYRLYLESDK